MSFFKLFNAYSDLNQEHNYNETLRGVFINTAYESNKSKCAEAYVENFLYNETLDMQMTVARLKDICSSTMLPIKEIECNPNHLCNIKCEDYDVKVEVENTGPYALSLSNEVYILPPIPNLTMDLERLRIDISPRHTFLKPITVPKFEIANVYEDTMKWMSRTNERNISYSSLLFKTYNDIGEHMINMFASGCCFVPCGYVISKCGHEPPNIKAVEIKPFSKFVLKVFKPMTVPMPDILSLLHV